MVDGPMADRVALHVSLLGGFEARGGRGELLHITTRKAQGLLAYLAVRPGSAQPRDKLASLLWGESAPADARNNFRQTLFALRQTLGPASRALNVTVDSIVLDGTLVDVDVRRLEWLVARGHPPALVEATDVYRGDFLEGLQVDEAAFEEWLLSERERLRELALAAHARLFRHQRARDPETAIRTGLRLLTLDPLQEPMHRALMQLYVDAGRRPAALRQYQLCVDVLRRELDVEPESATKALYQTILRAAPPPTPTRTSTRAPRHDAVTTAGPRLVGRTSELAHLREALTDLSLHRGSSVLILGETGIGKSRLMTELFGSAAVATRTLVGHSHESERLLAFGPWLEAFRHGGVSRDAEALPRLASTSRTALARLFPELGQTISSGASPIDARILFEAVDQLIATLAAERPLAIALEDLHWADELSGQLFAFVARRSRSRPVLLIGTTRAEDWSETAARPAFDELERDGLLSRMPLAPLSESETVELMRSMARTGTAADVERRGAARIWALSRGNPLVVVEAMHALTDGTTFDPDRLRSVPERIRTLIASRLERLSSRALELVHVAAVIGRQFDFSVLQRASRLDAGDAAAGLEELVRRHVIHGVGDRFDFTHDRIREVAYDVLLPPRRVILHGNAAAALQDVGVDDGDHAMLAHHFRGAEMWEQAWQHFRSAGARALTRAAYAEAAGRFTEALAALERVATTPATLAQGIDIRLDLRTALIPVGDVARVRDVLRQAADAAARLGDASRRAVVSVYLVHYGWLVGDYAAALAEADTAARLADEAGDRGAAMLVDLYCGQIHCTLGNWTLAIDHLRRAISGPLPCSEASTVGRPTIAAQLWLVIALTEVGQFDEAFARADAVLREAETAGHAFHQAHAHLACGLVKLRAGRVVDAIASLERGHMIVEAGGFDRSMVALTTRALLASAYALADRAEDAVRLAGTGDAAGAFPGPRSYITVLFAEALLLAGRVDAARELAEQALAWADGHGERGAAAWALRIVAEAAGRRESPDLVEARATFHAALARAADLEVPPLIAHCHLGLGAIYARASRGADARAELTQAAAAFRALGLTFWRERAEASLSALEADAATT